MSRDKMFRAWDTEAKCYVKEPILVDNFGRVYVVCEELRIVASTKKGVCIITHKPNVILERCTGIEDKNGKEICEGDIVLVANHGRTPYVVVYREGDCSFVANNEAMIDYVCMFKTMPQCYEVIGNINENHELLEKK